MMDWLHLAVLAIAGMVICALAYAYERSNGNDEKFLRRTGKAAGACAILLIVAGAGAGFWETVDSLGLVGIGFLALAWYMRHDYEYRLISLIFATCFLVSWVSFTDMTSVQKYLGVGLALFCCVMTEVTVRLWADDPDSQGHLVAVIN